MKKYYNGNSVVEMSFVMPLILSIWMTVIFALFYYHDKAVLHGAGYEAAVIGCELWMDTEEEKKAKVEQYFQERIKGKLLFFNGAKSTVFVDKKGIRIEAQSVRRRFRVKVEEYCVITEPEKEVRKIKALQQGMEGEKHDNSDRT